MKTLVVVVVCATIIFLCLLIIYKVGKGFILNEQNIHAARYYFRKGMQKIKSTKNKKNKPDRLSSGRIPAKFAEYSRMILNCLNEEIKVHQNTRFMPILHDAVKGGKRIRGSILLSIVDSHICQTDSDVMDEAVKLAACIELIHCSSLIFDDIMDGDIYRRGEPSIYYKYGVGDAIMAGILLLSTISKMANVKSADKLIRAQSMLANGQLLDLEADNDLLNLIDKKTSVLFRLSVELAYDLLMAHDDVCCEATTSLSCKDDDLRDKVSQAGADIGTAFQIADDFDDIEQDAAVLGGNKKNYVLKYGEQAAQNKIDELCNNCTNVFTEAGIMNDDIEGLLKMVRGACGTYRV